MLDSGSIKLALADDCGPNGNGVTCLNIFGGQGPDSAYIGNNLWSGSGSITPEMLSYFFPSKKFWWKPNDKLSIDLTGERFVNPQGFDVPVAFGYEHDKKRI